MPPRKSKSKSRAASSAVSSASVSPPPPRRPSQLRRSTRVPSARKRPPQARSASRGRSAKGTPARSASKAKSSTSTKTGKGKGGNSSAVSRPRTRSASTRRSGGKGPATAVKEPPAPKVPKVFLLVLLIPILMTYFVPGAKDRIEQIKELPPSQGYPLFIVAHVLAIAVCFPATIAFEWVAGAMFGQLHGFLVVSVSKTLGACLAFVVGRFVARGWVVHSLRGYPRASAALSGVSERPFATAVALRLSPVPSWVNNYGLSVTDISLPVFALATCLGGSLFILNNVSSGAGIGELMAGGGDYKRYLMTGGGVVAATLVGKIVAQASAKTEIIEVE